MKFKDLAFGLFRYHAIVYVKIQNPTPDFNAVIISTGQCELIDVNEEVQEY